MKRNTYVKEKKIAKIKNSVILFLTLVSIIFVIKGLIDNIAFLYLLGLYSYLFITFGLSLYVGIKYFQINNTKWQCCEGNCSGKHCFVSNFGLEVIKKQILFDRHDPCYRCDFEEECADDPEFIHTSDCEKYGKCTDREKLERGFERTKAEFDKKSKQNIKRMVKDAKKKYGKKYKDVSNFVDSFFGDLM